MRFIINLNPETRKLLTRIYKQSSRHESRQRAHCILLSHKGFTISELVDILGVHLNTIYNWLNGWEKRGLLSLFRNKGQGRRNKLGGISVKIIIELIERYPNKLKKVALELNKRYGIQVSVRTIIRHLKKTKVYMEKNT